MGVRGNSQWPIRMLINMNFFKYWENLGGGVAQYFFCKPGFFVFERNIQPFIMPIEIIEFFSGKNLLCLKFGSINLGSHLLADAIPANK
jgi:hypothetical protein